jgi:hypothetical protein
MCGQLEQEMLNPSRGFDYYPSSTEEEIMKTVTWLMPVVLLAAVGVVLLAAPARAADFTGTWQRGEEVIELRADKTGTYRNKDTGEATEFKWSTTDQKDTINIYYSQKHTWRAQNDPYGDGSIWVKPRTGVTKRFEKK